MHILWTLMLILGALAVLVLGLVGVVHDLLQRGPYEPPLIRNDGLTWPARYQGTASSGLKQMDLRRTTQFREGGGVKSRFGGQFRQHAPAPD